MSSSCPHETARKQLIDNGKNEYHVRMAAPNDIEKLLELHMKTFTTKNNFAIHLGRDYIKALYSWFIFKKGNYVVVADSQGKIAGLSAVSDRPYSAPALLACKREVIIGILKKPYLIIHPELIRRFGRVAFKKKSEILLNASYIAYSMVDTDFRRRGIITALRKEIYRISRSVGKKKVISIMRKDNIPIIKSKLKMGAVEIKEWSTKRFIYMVKYIN